MARRAVALAQRKISNMSSPQDRARAQAADVVLRAKALIESAKHDPKAKAKLDRANAALLHIKNVAGTTHADQTLTNVSVQYRNWDYIGQFLMPTVQVGQVSGRYPVYSKRDRMSSPDDSMSNRSTANEITENRSNATYACEPYALANFVEAAQLAAADAPLNEMVDLIAAINDHLAFKQEKRHAAILTTGANFGYTTALAGAAKWSDYTTGTSSPHTDITAAKRALWNPAQGPTSVVGYCSGAVYDKLVQHPHVVRDFKHVAGLVMPSRTQLAQYFGLDDLFVAEAQEDTANESQTAAYSAIWGNVFGVIRVARAPSLRTAAFGYTMQFGSKTALEWFDPRTGVKGGYHAKVGLEVDEKIVASDTGALITAVIA